MDDIVKQAMAKWPNVPACYGWLALDARGQWWLRDAQAQACGAFNSGIDGAMKSWRSSLGATTWLKAMAAGSFRTVHSVCMWSWRPRPGSGVCTTQSMV